MQAVQVLRHGSPIEAIGVSEIPATAAGPGEVRIAVSAASLNLGDIARARGGVAVVMVRPPFKLGMDVCGWWTQRAWARSAGSAAVLSP